MILYTVMAAVVQIAISISEKQGQLRNGFIAAGVLETLLLVISVVLIMKLSAPISCTRSSGSLRMFAQVCATVYTPESLSQMRLGELPTCLLGDCLASMPFAF